MFAAILTVTGPAGCLLIIKNYTATPPPRHALLCVPVKARAATLSEPTRTQDAADAVCSQGDRLNFGLAAERVRAFAPPLPRVYRFASLVCRSPKSSCSARARAPVWLLFHSAAVQARTLGVDVRSGESVPRAHTLLAYDGTSAQCLWRTTWHFRTRGSRGGSQARASFTRCAG